MKQSDPIAQNWASHIDWANMNGKDELRKLYIQLRNKGLTYEQAQAMGPVDLENGFKYDPLSGTLSGQDYSYNSSTNTTSYNGSQYKGYFDPTVLGSLTEGDVNTASSGQDTWLKGAQTSNEDWLNQQYAKELQRYGGLTNDSVDIDTKALLKKYGWDKTQNQLSQDYNQRVLEDAYTAAYNRINPNGQVKAFSDTKYKNSFNDFLNTDWTFAFNQPKNDIAAYKESVTNNPSIPAAVKEEMLKYAGMNPDQIAQAKAMEPKPITPQAPKQPVSPTQPSQPSTPSTPTTAATPQPTGESSSIDWNQLYDMFSPFLTNLSSKNQTSSYGSSVGYTPTTSYSSPSYSTNKNSSYSGKGA